MPRISNALIQERNEFILEMLRSQPDISRQEAQERFEEKFDATLLPKTFQQLKEQVQQERAAAPAPAEEPAHEEQDTPEEDSSAQARSANGASEPTNGAAAQPAKAAKAAKAKGQRNLFVDASKEQLVFLERIVQQLQEAGASNVRIDHSTDRWMVLTVDAK
ncbi:hypothetical protein [Hyalangium minutum]|uniref:Uncharacterized protein n=1 Tax=Hyalangium minutum TaxID=394096 RepID=A0A085WEW0_9BACT|nr:hypothetical protein [Hyalangium minutum]KFE66223.1 hypothetical protein DB31_1288 [Hyalangium minutum]